MNYSDYFENKVAANLSKDFNLIVLKTKSTDHLDRISETRMFPTSAALFSYVDTLDPYVIHMADNVITAKVMDYGVS